MITVFTKIVNFLVTVMKLSFMCCNGSLTVINVGSMWFNYFINRPPVVQVLQNCRALLTLVIRFGTLTSSKRYFKVHTTLLLYSIKCYYACTLVLSLFQGHFRGAFEIKETS